MAQQIDITRHNTQKQIDLIITHKVGTAADVYAIDSLVTQIKTAKGFKKCISFEHIIETALGM